jgi:hypothetical protein
MARNYFKQKVTVEKWFYHLLIAGAVASIPSSYNIIHDAVNGNKPKTVKVETLGDTLTFNEFNNLVDYVQQNKKVSAVLEKINTGTPDRTALESSVKNAVDEYFKDTEIRKTKHQANADSIFAEALRDSNNWKTYELQYDSVALRSSR